MSDADDELESIRERKREELIDQATGDGTEGGADAPARPVHIEGESHLREFVGEHRVVLVDFYADWCGPCQMLEPVVAGVAADTPAAVAKVDIDAHQDLAAEYRVQGVPTLYLFADGEPAERLVGMQDRETLTGLVQQYAQGR